MKITAKTNEDASYRGEPIRKMELALDRAMKKAGFSFMRTTKMGDRLFKKDGKTYSYHIQGQSGDPKYFDYVIVTKGEPGWDNNVVRDHFDDIYKAVTWLNTKTSEKRIAKKYGAKNEGPGAGYFIKLKNVHVDKAWVESSRQYSILKAKFSADWEANHSYWGGEGSADDFEVSIYLSRSLSEFMDWPGAEEEYAQKGSLFDFVKDTCLDDIKGMLNFDCGREGYTYGGGWTTKIPNDGVFEFDNMQFDSDYCTVYQYHDKSYVPVSITSDDMMYGIQDAWDEWSNPPEKWVVEYGTDDGDSEKEYFDNEDDARAFYDDHFGADGIDWLEKPMKVEERKSEASEQMAIDAYADKRFYDPEEFVKYVRKVAGKNGSYLSVDSVVSVDILDKANRLAQKAGFKKSEGAPDIEELRDQTISCGTLRSEDLVPKFLNVLKTYAPDKWQDVAAEITELDGWPHDIDDETLSTIVDELEDELNKIAPEGTYFGAHPDDGADFGFWSMSNESKKNEEVVVDLTLPEAKKIYADVHKNHWDKSKFGKVMGSCLEYEDVSELIDYLIGVYDPGIRDRLDENDELMNLCFILLDEWREEHGQTESKKSEKCVSERAIPGGKVFLQKMSDAGLQDVLDKMSSKGITFELTNTDGPIYAPGYAIWNGYEGKRFVGNLYQCKRSQKSGDWEGPIFLGWDKKLDIPYVYASGAKIEGMSGPRNPFERFMSYLDTDLHESLSESLTLKQAELKKMAKYGEAEDITGLSDAEAKELKKSGVELVGISRGTYGMNGALMRGTADGKLYVITSRNSNLFYFV